MRVIFLVLVLLFLAPAFSGCVWMKCTPQTCTDTWEDVMDRRENEFYRQEKLDSLQRRTRHERSSRHR